MKDADPTIAVSRFKATCLAVLANVQRTGKPVTVTRFGKPVARVVPSGGGSTRRVLGAYASEIRIDGDIVSPAVPKGTWDALHE